MKENEAFLFVGDMQSFDCLLADVLSLTNEDWLKYMDRKTGAASANTDTIPLVYDTQHRLNSSIFHEHHERFSPYIDEVILAAITHVGIVKTKQAMFTKLKANTLIPRHRDRGPLTAKTHRIHIPIITNTECIFSVGDEYKNLGPGQIWIIDNVNRYHSVENNGENDRIHLIIDAI